MSKPSTDPRLEPRHSIAVISRRTGISQLVLRAWERRYGAVVPGRTDTGRRRYSDQDLEKLLLLERLTRSGHRIGDIATLDLSELEQLARDFPPEPAPVTTPAPAAASTLLGEALEAVANLDSARLAAVLDRSLLDLSKPQLRNDLLVPMLRTIGDHWRSGKLRVAHEHMASSIVSTFLSSLNARNRVAPGAPLLAVATPAGQKHELGALLASGAASDAGWDVLYLGADLPAEEVASAARARGAQAVLLSLVFPHADPATSGELRELRRLIGPDLPLIVGGQAAPSYDEILREIGAQVVLSAEDLDRALSF